MMLRVFAVLLCALLLTSNFSLSAALPSASGRLLKGLVSESPDSIITATIAVDARYDAINEVVAAQLPAAVPLSGPAVQGSWDELGIASVVGVQLAAIPGTDAFLLMERPSGRHPDRLHYNAGWYDVANRTFTNVYCATSLENAAHSYTQNGTLLVLAGHKPQSIYPEGRYGIRVFNMANNSLDDVSQLQYGHWLATATQLPNGRIIVMSDSPDPVSPSSAGVTDLENPFYEIWDPESPKAPTLIRKLDPRFIAKPNKYFYYPINYVLPTGDLFVWCNTFGQIIDPMSGAVKVDALPAWWAVAPGLMSAYPWGSTSVMLQLTPHNNYTPEVVVFGGQLDRAWINTTAADVALRLRIDMDNGTTGYSFGAGWAAEKMPYPRMLGDSVLLPNGDVIVINGAQAGLMGDAAAGNVAMSNEPALWPVLYDPDAPPGSRFTRLNGTQIPRLLHSTAGLTTNGSIFVAGCDRCDNYWSTSPVSRSPWSFPEYRLEQFHPPVTFNTTHKPTILGSPDKVAMQEVFQVTYSLPVEAGSATVVTSASLVAPSSATHTRGMHQRVVGLEVVDNSHADAHTNGVRTVVLRGPPNANVAPPGMYMLFLMVDKVYSTAAWVTVKP